MRYWLAGSAFHQIICSEMTVPIMRCDVTYRGSLHGAPWSALTGLGLWSFLFHHVDLAKREHESPPRR